MKAHTIISRDIGRFRKDLEKIAPDTRAGKTLRRIVNDNLGWMDKWLKELPQAKPENVNFEEEWLMWYSAHTQAAVAILQLGSVTREELDLIFEIISGDMPETETEAKLIEEAMYLLISSCQARHDKKDKAEIVCQLGLADLFIRDFKEIVASRPNWNPPK